ncbi:hypothetical protein [Larkinella arboricola]
MKYSIRFWDVLRTDTGKSTREGNHLKRLNYGFGVRRNLFADLLTSLVTQRILPTD